MVVWAQWWCERSSRSSPLIVKHVWLTWLESRHDSCACVSCGFCSCWMDCKPFQGPALETRGSSTCWKAEPTPARDPQQGLLEGLSTLNKGSPDPLQLVQISIMVMIPRKSCGKFQIAQKFQRISRSTLTRSLRRINKLIDNLVGGLEHFLFSHMLGIIIPID